ncbi:Carboxymethylenebutenolidase [mine drainage metagenome]|uniref:Carboxymethylenebutenolidase n=1 Tax=mine drainage metagenome TaxID=410659 RepID=T1BVT5_9ZZZZ
METEGTVVELGPAHARFQALRASPVGPASNHPGLVLLHTALGLTSQEHDLAGTFASWGFEVVAPDLYSLGPDPPTPEDIREVLRILKDLPFQGSYVPPFEAVVADLPRPDQERLRRGARIPLYAPDPRAVAALKECVTALRRTPGVDGNRLACLGLSMGGGYAWTLGTLDPRVRAVVVCYGRPLLPWEDLARLSAPVLGIYAGKDLRLTSQLKTWESEMRKRGLSFRSVVYPEAEHGFLNAGDVSAYRPDLAAHALREIRNFLQGEVGPLRTPPVVSPSSEPAGPSPPRPIPSPARKRTAAPKAPQRLPGPPGASGSPEEVSDAEVDAFLSGSAVVPARRKRPSPPRKAPRSVRKAK